MSGPAWLIVRRAGCLWAVPAEGVLKIAAAGLQTTIRIGDVLLVADEVLGLRHQLRVTPGGPVFRSAAPAGCSGLAVCEDGPLIVVDPARPPSTLAGAAPHGG